MSYARFGWDGSDVYVYLHVGGYLTCCGCSLQNREWVDEPGSLLGGRFKMVGERVTSDFLRTDLMLEHLDIHRARGEMVAEDTYTRLREDRDEIDRWIAESS